jgi:hypothetical protein
MEFVTHPPSQGAGCSICRRRHYHSVRETAGLLECVLLSSVLVAAGVSPAKSRRTQRTRLLLQKMFSSDARTHRTPKALCAKFIAYVCLSRLRPRMWRWARPRCRSRRSRGGWSRCRCSCWSSSWSWRSCWCWWRRRWTRRWSRRCIRLGGSQDVN